MTFLLLRWNPSECRREDYKSIFQNYSSLHVTVHLNDRTDLRLVSGMILKGSQKQNQRLEKAHVVTQKS